MNISIDSGFTAIEDAASGPLHTLFPLLSVCFPSYLQNRFSYFTVLSATPSVKPSLTILAETAPFPHSFLAFWFFLGTYRHATVPSVFTCSLSISAHPPDCELSRSSICKSFAHRCIPSAQKIAGMRQCLLNTQTKQQHSPFGF